jgi:hypothetical protein
VADAAGTSARLLSGSAAPQIVRLLRLRDLSDLAKKDKRIAILEKLLKQRVLDVEESNESVGIEKLRLRWYGRETQNAR